MNKPMKHPIKQIAQIIDPNDLLNKFILYKYYGKFFVLLYVYDISDIKLFCFEKSLHPTEKLFYYRHNSIILIDSINADINSNFWSLYIF